MYNRASTDIFTRAIYTCEGTRLHINVNSHVIEMAAGLNWQKMQRHTLIFTSACGCVTHDVAAIIGKPGENNPWYSTLAQCHLCNRVNIANATVIINNCQFSTTANILCGSCTYYLYKAHGAYEYLQSKQHCARYRLPFVYKVILPINTQSKVKCIYRDIKKHVARIMLCDILSDVRAIILQYYCKLLAR